MKFDPGHNAVTLAQLTLYPNSHRKTYYEVTLRSDGKALLIYHSKIPGHRTGMRYSTRIPATVIQSLDNYLNPSLDPNLPDVETAVSNWLSNIPEPITTSPECQPIVPGTWRQYRLGRRVPF